MTDLNKALADAVLPHLESNLSAAFDGYAERIDARIADALKSFQPAQRDIVITVADRPAVNVGRQHAMFETLARVVGARCHAWVTGPAGSGKTVAAEKVAEGFGIAFSAVSIGPQTTQAHLFGYMDAMGTYRGTEVRTRFEKGGLLLLDEIDRGNAGVLTSLNALLANDVCAFPDGMIRRHPDFRIVAAANTVGSGANRQYVGAIQLDAATLDRFVVIEWGYDEAFEAELAASMDATHGPAWCQHVQALRASVAELGIRHIISPRATFNGLRLIAAGMDASTVENMTVWRGLDAASVLRVREHAKTMRPQAPAPADAKTPDGHDDHNEPIPGGSGLHACPKCNRGKLSVIQSRIDRDPATGKPMMVCWRKRGGCGHKWAQS